MNKKKVVKKTAKKKTVKSVSPAALVKEINKLKADYKTLLFLVNPKFGFITVTKDQDVNEINILNIDDIIYITTEEHYLKIFTTDGKSYVNYDSLANLDRKFSGHPYFLRTHKSYYANLKGVKTVKMAEHGRTLIYNLGKKKINVPVSYTYIGRIKEYFNF